MIASAINPELEPYADTLMPMVFALFLGLFGGYAIEDIAVAIRKGEYKDKYK